MSGALLEVSVVVVADGPWEETAACLSALARAVAGISAEVIVVDDGTTDGTAAALAGRLRQLPARITIPITVLMREPEP